MARDSDGTTVVSSVSEPNPTKSASNEALPSVRTQRTLGVDVKPVPLIVMMVSELEPSPGTPAKAVLGTTLVTVGGWVPRMRNAHSSRSVCPSGLVTTTV